MPAHIPNELWAALAQSLTASIASSSVAKKITTKQGHIIEYDEISASKHKSEIDEIDRVLAKQYGLNDEETDFIINYDIKYRMGADSGDAEVAD
jgi:response regulator RpfG family c-di-GMP phosphodiesterase